MNTCSGFGAFGIRGGALAVLSPHPAQASVTTTVAAIPALNMILTPTIRLLKPLQ